MTVTGIVLLLPLALGGETCADCHTEQHQQWLVSTHARSATSPLYLAMRRWAHAEAGEAVAARCVTCHTAPLATGGRSEAVECRVCHQGRSDGDPDTLLVHPNGAVLAARPAPEAPHPVNVSPHFAGEKPCLPCHAQFNNPAGVPLCTTGEESAVREGGVHCTGCHRPHTFAATFPEVLARAATVSLQQLGDRLRATVIARGVGHALPTGTALRQVRLEVEIRSSSGGHLADNFSDPEALFARLLADGEGNAPAPPWRAVTVARDSRLAAGERRVLEYPIPQGAASAEARLVYHRAPSVLLARLGLAEHPELAPRVIARAALSLHLGE